MTSSPSRTAPHWKEVGSVLQLVSRVAPLPDVRAEVEANHDDNRWWPIRVTDPRMRMAVAGWSTRVSYRMVDTYARVVEEADRRGFDALVAASDAELAELVWPLGLAPSRVAYFRSLTRLWQRWEKEGVDPVAEDADSDVLVQSVAREVYGASYKVAQCAVLYARGYHCGIIPVDSGMVTKLAPGLGIDLPSGPVAHERLRHVLEGTVRIHADGLRAMVSSLGYQVSVPTSAVPTWWTHLVLIYFKRLYLNRPSPRLCAQEPFCPQVVDCAHAAAGGGDA
ncbi:hypothetical protein AB0J38_02175 [Streptomyces sp. NPDC050095]|uniref:hypothetical protein n=1 Tax=unclassified Streptomyces TaxID=2593676 RepID=UPI00343E1367